jgi:hypothetical protein
VIGRDYYGVFPLRGKLLNVPAAAARVMSMPHACPRAPRHSTALPNTSPSHFIPIPLHPHPTSSPSHFIPIPLHPHPTSSPSHPRCAMPTTRPSWQTRRSPSSSRSWVRLEWRSSPPVHQSTYSDMCVLYTHPTHNQTLSTYSLYYAYSLYILTLHSLHILTLHTHSTYSLYILTLHTLHTHSTYSLYILTPHALHTRFTRASHAALCSPHTRSTLQVSSRVRITPTRPLSRRSGTAT